MSRARDIHGAIACTSEVAWNSIKAEQFGSGITRRKQQDRPDARGSAKLNAQDDSTALDLGFSKLSCSGLFREISGVET